jgi:hypothetical protein
MTAANDADLAAVLVEAPGVVVLADLLLLLEVAGVVVLADVLQLLLLQSKALIAGPCLAPRLSCASITSISRL